MNQLPVVELVAPTSLLCDAVLLKPQKEGHHHAVTMVATSTLKTKSSECVSELVDRRCDQACIEKGTCSVAFLSVRGNL